MNNTASNSFELESRARRRHRQAALVVTYSMGTFNDNFFKQAALLLAATAGLGGVQGLATMLFALPFILFSAWGGWLADRLPKKNIVIMTKTIELMAMGLAFYSLYTLNWPLVVFVVFFMGLQSTFFSPAINGAIPENFPPLEVPKVNAVIKLVTTAAILLGIAGAALLLDLPQPAPLRGLSPAGAQGFGRMAVGLTAAVVAVLGLITAFGVSKNPFFRPSSARFPWFGPVNSALNAVRYARHDKDLFVALMGEAFFYFISSFIILCVNNYGIRQLGYSLSRCGMLSVALMVGICAGSIFVARRPAEAWRKSSGRACAGMGLGILASALCVFLPEPVRYAALLLVYVFTGLCGGAYLIPIVSFIQIRPEATEKGLALGTSNFNCFTGILISGLLGLFLLPEAPAGAAPAAPQLAPSTLLAFSGGVILLFSLWLKAKVSGLERLPEAERPSGGAGRNPGVFLSDLKPGPLGRMLRFLLSLRYSVSVKGLDKIAAPDAAAKNGLLIMPNHPALTDPLIIYSLLFGLRPRTLSDAWRMSGLLGGLAGRVIRPILIPDLAKSSGAEAKAKVEEGVRQVVDSLAAGDSVLLYPAGRIYRSDAEKIGGNSAVAHILAARPGQRIVLARTSGLWGSSFSFAGGGKSPAFAPVLLKNVLRLCCNFLFFMPKRKVEVEFYEVDSSIAGLDLPRSAPKLELNAWLENFYNQKPRPAQAVPYYFWQGARPYDLPPAGSAAGAPGPDPARLRDAMRGGELEERVYALLREAGELGDDVALDPRQKLGGDLGLDSLAAITLGARLEQEFNRRIPNPASLITVADCLLAAAGLLEMEEDRTLPPADWFRAPGTGPLPLPRGGNIAAAFFELVRENPSAMLLGDRKSRRTRRETLTAALIFSRRLRALPGTRLGIMLPAAPAVPILWLAAMLAGKECVFLNWTVGETNLRHCLEASGARHVVSAGGLMDRLELQGLPLKDFPVRWIRLEEEAKSLGWFEKIRGALQARFRRGLAGFEIRDTAAILFTSGSEARPKGVPLSHGNLLGNISDAAKVLQLRENACVLAMLPPFHSFGLIADMVLPLALGVRAAFYPNPTEAGPLADTIEDFKVTLLPGTPTFLDGILERGKGGRKLNSLRLAFVGAEKCPESVYAKFAAVCPQADLCEGYGITECSPVVAVNLPGRSVPGSIGPLLPSLTGALVREEDGVPAGRVRPGETGLLLLRGPSVFAGYLSPDDGSPFVDFEGAKWYRTGDLVRAGRHENLDWLYFMGRLKRFVKIGGEMISLPQVESVLLEAFGARPDAPADGPALAVEAAPEEAGAEIVLFTPLPLTLKEVNAALRQAGLSALYSVRRIVRLERIPVLGTGKTDYKALRPGPR